MQILLGPVVQRLISANLRANLNFNLSLWARSPGHSGGAMGKGRRACNYVSGIKKICSEKVCASCWLVEMTYSYDDSSIFHMFFNVCIHSSSFLLCADWWKSDSSADKEPLENWRQNSNSKDVVAGWLYFYKEEKSKIYRRERRVCITAW